MTIIGIDLGTSNSPAAVLRGGRPVIIPSAEGLKLKKQLEAALRETKDALLKKDVAQATDRAEALKKVLKEAGATLYTQSGQAEKGGPYAETRWQGPTPQPHVGAAGAQANPSGDGPRGKVMDAEYRENKQK